MSFARYLHSTGGIQACLLKRGLLFYRSARLTPSIIRHDRYFCNGYPRRSALDAQVSAEPPTYIPPLSTNEKRTSFTSFGFKSQLKMLLVEYADLPTIDLAKSKTPDDRKKLAGQLCEA